MPNSSLVQPSSLLGVLGEGRLGSKLSLSTSLKKDLGNAYFLFPISESMQLGAKIRSTCLLHRRCSPCVSWRQNHVRSDKTFNPSRGPRINDSARRPRTSSHGHSPAHLEGPQHDRFRSVAPPSKMILHYSVSRGSTTRLGSKSRTP